METSPCVEAVETEILHSNVAVLNPNITHEWQSHYMEEISMQLRDIQGNTHDAIDRIALQMEKLSKAIREKD